MLPCDQPPPDQDDEDNDSGPVEEEQEMTHIRLARTHHMWFQKVEISHTN